MLIDLRNDVLKLGAILTCEGEREERAREGEGEKERERQERERQRERRLFKMMMVKTVCREGVAYASVCT